MPFQIDGRGDMNAFVLTSPLAGVMLLTRRQPFYPSAAHDKFFSICTAFGGYTEFGIAPLECILLRTTTADAVVTVAGGDSGSSTLAAFCDVQWSAG